MGNVSGPGNSGPHTGARAGRHGRSLGSNQDERLAEGTSGTAPAIPQQSPEWEEFEEMFLASRAKFLSLALGILRNKEDAEDALQDALLSAYVHLRRFEGRSAIKTWFTRVVVNASLMIRRKRKHAHVELALETDNADGAFGVVQIPASGPDPEKYCAETETLDLVDVLIGKLSPPLREAFTMTYVDEIPAKQAGALLGVAAGTFKSRLCRAKRRFKHLAKRSLVTPIGGVRPLRFFYREADFQEPGTKTGEVWAREMAF